MSKYEKALEQYRMSPKEASDKSNSWFKKQTLKLNTKSYSARQIIGREPDGFEAVSKISVGSMYIFEYRAEHAAKLNYWDRFPLCLPLYGNRTHFTGINLHYLPPIGRAKVLDVFTDPRTANALAKSKLMQPCIKQYIIKNINSKIMQVDSEDWVGTLMLPIESFIGASSAYVWQESYRK